jgi:hypothetical protein
MDMEKNKTSLMKVFMNYSVPLLFMVICLIGVYASKLNAVYILNEISVRLSRNLFMVLALIIPVIAGMGLNFAIVIGAMAGQIGLITVKIFDIGGFPGFLMAVLFATPFALLFGYGTGLILNKTKGKEMITSLMLGYFANGLYQLVFLTFMGTIIPVDNPEIILSGGVGLKNALDLKLIQYAVDNLFRPKLCAYTIIPMPPIIIDSIVPTILCLFTFIPFAAANLGLSPAAIIATPVFVFKNIHIKTHPAPKSKRVPVGTGSPNILKDIILSVTLANLSANAIVVLRPLPPIAQIISGLLKGSSSQPMHISDTMEKPI